MIRRTSCRIRRAFAIRDLAVVLTGLVIAFGLLASLTGANRDLSKATVCASNLHQLFGGLVAYVNQYNSYPPHNPYPTYSPSEAPGYGWDPNLGWILTYGLGLEPPARYSNGHFNWQNLDLEDLPSVVVCPAASPDLFDLSNPEIESSTALEPTSFKYAAFYQTGGNARAATTVLKPGTIYGAAGMGGRNPPVPDPNYGLMSSHAADNANGGVPYIYVQARDLGAAPDRISGGAEYNCWVQAIHPAEVQQPGRMYYMADSRDYRPSLEYPWPPAGINDGWLSGYGNKIYLGTRHDSYANVMYLDGRVTRDGQTHFVQWNMDYDAATGQPRSSQWRCSTFATNIDIADIHTQVHNMPVLMVKGWEYFFDADGLARKIR